MKWSSWTAVAAGIWLLLAPFATGYSTFSSVATAEAIGVGLVIAGFAAWAAFGVAVPSYVDYVLLLAGAWSIVAPFALGYSDIAVARTSDMTVGIVVAIVALFRSVWAMPGRRQNAAA